MVKREIMNLKFTGGSLRPGDFIAVAYSNSFTLGFFAGYGRGTVQYYHLFTPDSIYKDYLNFKQDPSKFSPYMNRKFADGFSKKCIWKMYVNSPHGNRIIKLDRPEDVLDQENLEMYNNSREALIEAKIIER